MKFFSIYSKTLRKSLLMLFLEIIKSKIYCTVPSVTLTATKDHNMTVRDYLLTALHKSVLIFLPLNSLKRLISHIKC